MKNILFVNFVDNYGGGEIYLENVINEIIDKNCFDKLYLISPKNNPINKKINHKCKVLFGYSRYKKFLSLKNFENYYSQIKEMNKIIKKYHINYVFLNGKEAIYLSFFLKNTKKVGVLHTNIEGDKILLKRYLNKISIENLYRLVVVSPENKCNVQDVLGKNYDDKIRVIFNGVDESNIIVEDNKSDDKCIFLMLSRLIEQKGIYDLVSAVENINQENILKNIEFWIGGDGELKGELDDLIRVKELSAKIKLLGFVDSKKVLKEADVVILPSHKESMPMCLVEAAAAKKCIIATDVGGIKNIVKDNYNGFLVKPKDIQDLTEKIKRVLYLTKDEIKEMGNRSYDIYKEDFTFDKMINNTIDTILGEDND